MQAYTDEQQAHGEPTELGEFYVEFMQSTLETLPAGADEENQDRWQLPDTPLQSQD